MLREQLGHAEVNASQPIDPVQVPAVDRQAVIRRRGSPYPGPARRIDLLDDRLDVAGGQLRGDVATHGGHGNDLNRRVEQRHTEGHGVVDSRIAVENHLLGHITPDSTAPLPGGQDASWPATESCPRREETGRKE